MKVTALEEYGLRCMLLFARKGTDKTLTLPEISTSEGLSIPYAGKLLMILKKSGLVKAVRGRSGGYRLSRSPEEIVLKEIFDALGEPLYGPHHCNRYSGDNDCCVHMDGCTMQNIWNSFGKFINVTLENVTLADLASGNYTLPEMESDGKSKESNQGPGHGDKSPDLKRDHIDFQSQHTGKNP